MTTGSSPTPVPPGAGDDRSKAKPPARPQSDATARELPRGERESRAGEGRPQGMVPARERRRTGIERGAMRVIATGGIIGIATIVGAVLVSQDVAGWIVGAAVSLTSLALAALLWSSRQL